ncbi:hypothetical protein 2 [Teucrium fruticans sobemo-like virus]|nr:hypothetical protein 2 [Teucrium fruticans sobemo-like virus]
MKSLAVHAALHEGLRTDPPLAADADRILSDMDEEYPSWSIPEDFLTRSHFERVVRSLDWTSSPGYPYLTIHPTNAQFFGVVEGEPSQDRLEVVWNLVSSQISEARADPIRLFVKPEPHKEAKISDGRFRLISSVSVVDQIIDHMLHDEYDAQLAANWMTHPPKVGWTPFIGGWKAFPRYERPLALDKKAWDWTVRPWLLWMSLEHRKRRCSNLTQEWVSLAEMRWKHLYGAPVFVTSGGALLQQNTPGVRKSGCVTTLTDNSLEQDILHRRVSLEMVREGHPCPPPLWGCMGDDTYQEAPSNVQRYVDLMAQFCIVKQAVLKPEFCGFRFLGSRVEPMYL